MTQIFCPNCNELQYVYYSTEIETITLEDGGRLSYINTCYYCAKCNTFLESKRKENPYENYESNNSIKLA